LQIQRYVGRISGPLLDRIDIHIDVPAVRFRALTGDPPQDTEDSTSIRQRVIRARERQRQRFAAEGIFSNAVMTPRLIRKYCRIDAESESMLERAMSRLGLSARAYDRILKSAARSPTWKTPTISNRRTSLKLCIIVRSIALTGPDHFREVCNRIKSVSRPDYKQHRKASC